MRIAKADQDDMNSLSHFLMAIEKVCETNFDLKEWETTKEENPSEYEFYKILRSISMQVDDDYQICGKKLAMYFNTHIAHKWRRVTYAAESLIEHCCDPAVDYLAYKPSLIAPQRLLKEILDSGNVRTAIQTNLSEAILNEALECIKEEETESK